MSEQRVHMVVSVVHVVKLVPSALTEIAPVPVKRLRYTEKVYEAAVPVIACTTVPFPALAVSVSAVVVVLGAAVLFAATVTVVFVQAALSKASE